MKKRLLWGTVVAAVLLFAGFLLWRVFAPQPKPSPAKKPVPVVTPAQGREMTVYYINRKYVESGDESIPKLIPVKTKIAAQDADPAEALARALQNQPPSAEAGQVVRKDLKILDVRVTDGVAYVNFSSKNLYGGSLEEMLLVQAMVKTLTELDGVKKVQFLVDGQIRETLMGHISISDPIGDKDL